MKEDAKKNEQILATLLKEEENRKCADCSQKGTRWASWNIGVFLCIRCGGLHRKLGTHISRVKSVTLDSWTTEEVKSMQEKGNAKMNAIYNPDPTRHPFPTYAGDMEQYIRDKYERKLFMNASPKSPVMAASVPMSLASMAKQSFTKTTPSYTNELKHLQDMGFNNKTNCLDALKASNGDIYSCIDSLTASKDKFTSSDKGTASKASSKYSDPYEDLLGVSFGEMNLSKSPVTSPIEEENDWGDLEFAASTPPLGTAESSQDPPQKPTEPAPPSTVKSQPEATSNPWASTSSNLTSVLGKSNFYAEDDDPFKDLTHNPFK